MVTYGRGLFLSGQPHPHLKGAGSHCSPILGVPFYLCTLYHGTTKFDMVTHMGKGRGMFLNGQPRPHPKGSGLCARKFLKFPLIFAYTLCRRTAKFDVVTHVGEVHVSWGQPCLLSQESGVPVIPNFWSSGLCLHPLTQKPKFGMVTHKGCVFGGPPSHCVCTNVSCGVSPMAEFLVSFWVCDILGLDL